MDTVMLQREKMLQRDKCDQAEPLIRELYTISIKSL